MIITDFLSSTVNNGVKAFSLVFHKFTILTLPRKRVLIRFFSVSPSVNMFGLFNKLIYFIKIIQQ